MLYQSSVTFWALHVTYCAHDFLREIKGVGYGKFRKTRRKRKGRNETLKSEGNMRTKDGRIERKRREGT